MVATRKYKLIEGPDAVRHKTVFHTIPTAGDLEAQEMIQPGTIAEAKIDKRCPRCELTEAEGFDLGIENGEVFGALCPGCGWSF